MSNYASHYSSPRRAQHSSTLSFANRLLILLIISGIFALTVITFYPEWKKLCCMRQALQKDNQELSSLEKKATHREHELYLIQHDKEYLEMIARDRLDLMKPNETIFRFNASRNNTKP